MSNRFLDVLARHTANKEQGPEQKAAIARELQELCAHVAELLSPHPQAARQEVLGEFSAGALEPEKNDVDELPPDFVAIDPVTGKPTPELIEWARQQYTEEQNMASIREVMATGGLELKDFIRELEEAAGLQG